ncbi:hypothetical protein LTR56_001413 [Elasticomyces elasticus]|nr:hypothetical protein LTR56_001413 [Elasticomyces elasticus]KAK3668665.1 hypothetical protein LTR22_000552 [Elasticomyces elasticus]KAK4932017.1 hypothetical protein LTR49_001704 [Elasticomyces elasticus]KAK5768453.1 hypothetical protein LTS12_001241 [Elasticomyces elasticus]
MCRFSGDAARRQRADRQRGQHVRWMRKNSSLTHDQQRDTIGKALEHQQRLGYAISLLRRQQAAPDSSSARANGDLAKTMEDMETCVQGLDAFFSDFLSPVFYNEKQPLHAMGDTSAAQKVFDLPELLELVLEYVEEVDILRFHQVNRSARASIDGSPRLQSRLSLRIDSTDKQRRYPFGNVNSISSMTSGFICNPNTPGRRFHVDAPGPFPEDRVLVQARFELRASGVGKIDARCRSMHVAQPPILDMQLRLRCCDKALLDEHKSDIHSDVGVTIGDLWDAAVKAQEEHRLCPHASRALHDADGFVMPNPSFVAFVAGKLPEEHAISRMIGCPPGPTAIMATEVAAQRKASEDRMGAYMAYKRKAHTEKSSIMTLKEFEAAGLLPEYLSVVEREGQLTAMAQPLSAQWPTAVHTFSAPFLQTAPYQYASNPPFPPPPNQLGQPLVSFHTPQTSQPAQGGLINLPPLQQLLTTLPQQQQPGATHDNHPQQ